MAARSSHGALVATTVATVNLSIDYAQVKVVNRNGTAEIFFRTDGVSPTVAGTDCHIVPAVAGATTTAPSPSGNPTTVGLISSGTPTYSVVGVD